jgi:hypothetical protein
MLFEEGLGPNTAAASRTSALLHIQPIAPIAMPAGLAAQLIHNLP